MKSSEMQDLTKSWQFRKRDLQMMQNCYKKPLQFDIRNGFSQIDQLK